MAAYVAWARRNLRDKVPTAKSKYPEGVRGLKVSKTYDL